MSHSTKDVIVLHRYGDQSHFLAIDDRVCRYLICDPFFVLVRALKGKVAPHSALKNLRNIFSDWLQQPRATFYVYGFSPESLYFILLCLAWWRPGQRILFSSFSDPVGTLGLVQKIILRTNLRFAKLFFNAAATVSLSAKNTLVPYLRTELVEHTVDAEGYRRHNKRNGLVFLGRITPYKNVDRVVTASASQGYALDLVGSLEMNLALLNGMPEGVRYLGTQTKNWIMENLGRYKALILASDPREPFGIVLLEAMAAGALVVASHTHGSRTIFRDWPDYPLLFDSGSPSGLSEALSRLTVLSELEEEKLRERLISMVRNYRPDERARIWKKVLS